MRHLTVCVLGALFVVPCLAQTPLPFANPGFETDTDADGYPDGWGKRVDEPGAVTLDAGVRHSGASAVRIHHDNPSSYSSVIQGIPNQWPGQRMVASVWVKCQGIRVRGIGPRLYCGYEGGWGHTSRAPALDAEGNCDWQQVTVPFNTRDKRAVEIHLYLHESTGTIWFDDFQVIPEPAVLSAPALPAAPAIDGDASDAPWLAVAEMPLVSTDSGAAEPGAWAKLAHDADTVYACARVPVSANSGGQERVSLLIDPDGAGDAAAEFWVDATGARGTDGVERSAPAVEWHGRSLVSESVLTAEFAVPIETLQPSMRTAERWKLSVVCARPELPELELLFTGLNPRNPALFTDLAFPQFDLSAYRTRELRARLRALIDGYRALVEGVRIDTIPDAFPQKAPAKAALGALGAEVELVSREAGTIAEGTPAQWRELAERLATVEGMGEAARAQALPVAAYTHSRRFAKKPTWGATVVSSMRKVLREPALLTSPHSGVIDLALAQGEAESAQIVVLPLTAPVKGVRVKLPAALRGPDGSALGGDCLQAHGVGYVRVEKPNHARSADAEWWPDMLLPLAPLDVPADQVAPVWLTVTAPRGAEPGIYTGKVTLTAEKAHQVVLDLRVRVYGFELPLRPALRTSFGMGVHWISRYYHGDADSRRFIDGPTYRRWCDELLRHRVSPYLGLEFSPERGEAGEYVHEPWEGNFAHCVQRGQNSAMLAIMPATPDHGPEYADEFKRQFGADLRAMCDRLRTRGWLELAFVCAWDEPRASDYAGVLAGHRLIREVCPEVKILQTVCYDDKPEGLIGQVDIWCPITSRFNRGFYGDRARAGEEVWWYVCCGPRPPMANFFVDQDAIDHRVLFWQTWQQGVQGLLYWQTTWWGDNCPPGGTMRQADPSTWVHPSFKAFQASGDGQLLYPGAEVSPLPSVRLEVIRDGIEDYDYLALLNGLVKTDTPQAVQAQAHRLLTVDDTLSRSLGRYTKDPRDIETRRRQIGELIERLGGG